MSYTNRKTDVVTVKEINAQGWVVWTDGWCIAVPDEHLDRFFPGAEFIQESIGMGVTGVATLCRTGDGQAVVGQWLWRKSDEDRQRERHIGPGVTV